MEWYRRYCRPLGRCRQPAFPAHWAVWGARRRAFRALPRREALTSRRLASDRQSSRAVHRLASVRRVGRPDDHCVARDGQVTVGVEAVARGGTGVDRAAGDRHREVIVRQVGICRIQAVVRGVDRNITGANVQLRALKALAAIRDVDRGAVRAVRTDVQHQVAVNGAIRGVDGQRAALDVQKLLGVDGVVDGCIDIQRQIADGQRRFAVLIRRRAGFDAVFAVGRDGQLSIAAEGDKRAILTLNDGVFGIFVFGVVVVIVLLGIAQGIFRTVGNKDGHLARLAAGDGGGVLTRKCQAVQHQRHAGRTLFHLDGAVRAAARDGVSAARRDGERRAVDLVARVRLARSGHAAFCKGKGHIACRVRRTIIYRTGAGHE